jgi:hypothetical protein
LKIVPPAGDPGELKNVIYMYDKEAEEDGTSIPTSLEDTCDPLSEPFSRASLQTTQDLINIRVNTAFYNHSLKPLAVSSPVSVSLFSLITRFREVGASDPRDKVFAFLHLATEIPGMKPNYKASVQEVFKGAAKLLLNSHNFAVISHVQDPTDTRVSGVPGCKSMSTYCK